MSANRQFDEDLKRCNNMDQVLDVVQKYYALDRPFGIATKLLVIAGIKKILDMVKAAPRTTIIK
jgi:hypothetical protein